ncbi:MAG: DoxX family membrane protein [Rhizobiaceae bacterium]
MDAGTLFIVGRVVFGAFFLIAGVRNFMAFSERKSRPTNYGWFLPGFAMAVGFAVQFLAGLALIADFQTVAAAAALIAFLLVATPLYHNPLMFKGQERAPHLYLTLVNVTLAAGLLMVIADAL